jgi:ribosomal-protein-alanine N-acetyltransferase
MTTEIDIKKITIETERLILRPFRQEDVDDLFEYAKNPNVGPNAGWKPHESKEESQKILDHFISENEVLAITDKSSGKVIGSIGLHKDDKRSYPNARMVGYVLSETYWGLGAMTEAVKALIEYVFTNTEIDILTVMHFPFNTRSKRVIEKCGFKYEVTLRKASVIYDGSVQDDLCYSLLKEEWLCSIKAQKN